MIRETIVTTASPDGRPHVAPMGATPIEGGWLLQPFRPSTTLENFLTTRCGVVNFTDDARIFAGCVTKRRPEWPTVRAETVDSVRLAAALSHHEVRVERVEDGERPKLICSVVHSANHRAFGGLNRAIAAVLEGAVLVSRLHMLSAEKIEQEFAYLQIAIDKTAGEAELEAWSWLIDAVEAHRRRAAS
ncbi:DUF447 domain-containing protein [Chenggangzhangella methanolivorans]|uniref:DUF447 family protein n=1 Tax=Chenggangzhangella methanolivorans TaxID=1437009 RepID=A0A9E6UNH1_9HYPH|nr:DUF447 domain-containing protein [Chenggangzhangella methanolivorans]QZO00184.1 DUF447 family protein [Chenggangzhangella methanolivorans]